MGDGLGQRLGAADLRELDQQRQVHAADHLHLAAVAELEGEVGGRATHDVREDHDAVAGVHPGDRAADLLAA